MTIDRLLLYFALGQSLLEQSVPVHGVGSGCELLAQIDHGLFGFFTELPAYARICSPAADQSVYPVFSI